MRKYTIFHPLVMAFFSKEIYRDVARNWGGNIVLYLLLLLAICWLPTMVEIQILLNRFVTVTAPPLVEQLPTITIQNGIASIDQPSPYTIRDPKTKDALAIIDISGRYTSLDQTNAQVLLTQKKLFVAQNDKSVREYNLSNITDMVITKQTVYMYLDLAKHWIALIFYPFLLLISFLYRLLQVVIYAAIGTLIFNKIVKTDLDYSAILRVAIIAITPTIIISTILEIFFQPLPGIIYFLISMIYLFFGLVANQQSSSTTAIKG